MTENALIDTIDSGAHYRVLGSVDEVEDRLTAAHPNGPSPRAFVAFTLAGRGHRAIRIAPDKVIAVLEPS